MGLDVGSTHIGIGHDPETTEGPGGQRISIWVYADDCGVAVERLRAAGVRVVEEPADQP